MRAQGRVEVSAARRDLYAALSDPRRLEDALPAVDSVDVQSDDRFAVAVAPATALGTTPFDLVVEIADRREAEHVRLSGTGHGPEYTVSFAVELDFADAGVGTEVAWVAHARFGGVLSSLGQRVLPMILAEQVERILRAGAGVAASGATA